MYFTAPRARLNVSAFGGSYGLKIILICRGCVFASVYKSDRSNVVRGYDNAFSVTLTDVLIITF